MPKTDETATRYLLPAPCHTSRSVQPFVTDAGPWLPPTEFLEFPRCPARRLLRFFQLRLFDRYSSLRHLQPLDHRLSRILFGKTQAARFSPLARDKDGRS